MQSNSFKTKAFIFFASILGVVSNVQAESAVGVFIEPSITLESGSTEGNFPAPLKNSDGDLDGLGIGLRGGIHVTDIVFLGLDLCYSHPNFDDSSVNYDAGATATNWGPVIGAQLPIVGLRTWGSVILGARLDPKRSGNFDVLFNEATGYRIGAGFKVALVSLNLEYQYIEYDKTTLQALGPFSSNSALNSVKLEQSSLIASVSFPLAL